MAYTPPTIAASSQTWANLQARGVEGYVNALLAANTASQANVNRTHQLMQKMQGANLFTRLNNTVDNYTSGRSDKVSAKADLLEIDYALKALTAAVEEIGVLIDAN